MKEQRQRGVRWVGLLVLLAAAGCASGVSVPQDAPTADHGAPKPQAASPSPRDKLKAAEQEMAEDLARGKPTLRERPAPSAGASSEVSPSPAPTPQSPAAGSPAQPCAPGQTPSQIPGWVTRTGPLQGRGESTASQDDADAQARKDLLKQLEVQVAGKDEVLSSETTDQGFRYAVKSETVESVNLSVSGLSVQERWTDQCRGLHYALAVLDRKQAAQAWLHDLQEQARKGEELRKQADSQEAVGQVFRTLLTLHRLMESQEISAQIRRRLRIVSPESLAAAPDIGQVAVSRHRLETILTGVHLRKAGGDDQVAKPGRPLAEPLGASVMRAQAGGDTPVADVPVRFEFAGGQGDVEPQGRTDAKGLVTSKVRRVEPGPAAEVVARLAIEELTADFPPALRTQVDQRLGREMLRYRITPPRSVAAGNPLDDALAKLAAGLAERLNDSYGAVGEVRPFVENRSQRRLSISQRIETAIASHLAQLDALRLVQSPEQPRPGTRSTAKAAAERPTAAVSGVYELDAGGGLWMEAKVVRLTDQVMEATIHGTIPRNALGENDLRELSGGRPAAAAPPVPPASPTQPVAEWVEVFWNLRNPSGFQTELVPEQPTYRVSEKAKFRFRTTRDCYLTVVNVGASGTLTQLLPNFERPEPAQTLVRVKMGWVTIPSTEDGFDFTVSAPVGTERVKAICTLSPVKLIENADPRQGLFQLSPNDTARFRDLQPTKQVLEAADWSTAETQIITLEANQSETRGMRGLRSRGLTEGK